MRPMPRRPFRALLRRPPRRLLSLLLGAVFTLVLLEVGLTVAYRVFDWYQFRSNLAAMAGGDHEITIVCIGESTTAVAGDETGTMLVPRTSYPAQLEQILNERQTTLRFRVLNNGIMGGTSGSALELLQRTMAQTEPQMIIAMMGIKDTPNEWVPVSALLPRWMNSLRTVQLASWLLESWRLRHNQNVTDIKTFSSLPPSAQQKVIQLGNYLKEGGIASDPEAMERARAAIYLLRIGQLRQAETIMREVSAERGVGSSLLAEILVTAGRHDEAYRVLEEAIAAHPGEGMYRVVLADLHLRQKDYATTRRVLEEARLAQPTMTEPELTGQYIQLAWVDLLLAEGAYDEALATVDQIQPIVRPEYHDVLPPARLLVAAARARAHMGRREWDEAEKNLLEALEISPRRHANMWLLSQVYRETGQHEKEEAIRWKLLETQGRVAEYFELAKLFRLSGQPERVPEVLAMAVEHTPSLTENYAALYALAEQHGARLVVMQYPSFDLESLHLYAPERAGVDFVDNLHVFDADPVGYFFEPTFPNSFSQIGKSVV